MNKFMSYTKKAFHFLTVASSSIAVYGAPVAAISPKAAGYVAAGSAAVNLALHLVTTVNPSLSADATPQN